MKRLNKFKDKIRKNNPPTLDTTQNQEYVAGDGSITHTKPDPSEYSTTIQPAEVPCQKEVYYFTINNLLDSNSRVLDVGSGLGYGMAILSVIAKEVHGVDVDKKAIDYSIKEYKGKNPKITMQKVYDGYKLPYKNNYFDVITCVDVIEHVEDYDRFIKELLRVAKKFIVFGTPNRRPEHTNPDGSPKNYWHLREWNQKELNEILLKHSKNIDWYLIDGPWDGPFTINKRASKDTMVLMPVIRK